MVRFSCHFTLVRFLIVASLALGAFSSAAEPGRRVQSLDFDWRFHLGEVPGAEQTTFSDQTWRMLDVPHDWSIEGPFDRANPGGTFFGFLPGGVGWYRREIQIGADERDRKVFVEFDGIYENSEVWINGESLGRQGFGYTSFQRDLTPHLRFDSPNQLAVRVENLGQPNSRWYTGSGIYRHVRLVTKPRLHIDRHGVYVTTPQVTAESALVRVRTTLRNQRPDAKSIRLATRVLDSDGRELARTTSLHDLPTGANVDLTQDLVVPRPSFWSPDTPVLYALESRVLDGGTVMDSVTTSFGIRTFAFDKDRGFFLNAQIGDIGFDRRFVAAARAGR